MLWQTILRGEPALLFCPTPIAASTGAAEQRSINHQSAGGSTSIKVHQRTNQRYCDDEPPQITPHLIIEAHLDQSTP